MKRSYVCAPLKEPHMYETVPDRMKQLSEDDPEREAFVFYDFRLQRLPVSRKQLYDTSVKIAKKLVHMGLKKGDKVAFCMNNSLEMLFTNMATITAGGIPFYLSTNLRDGSDVIDVMSLMECKMLFIDSCKDDNNWRIIENIWSLSSKQSSKVPSLLNIICNGLDTDEGGPSRLSMSELITGDSDIDAVLPQLDPEDILAYLCTSGSTGKSKNVAYTHFGLLNWTRKTDIAMNITGSSRYFNDRQFSWAVGYPRSYLATGITRIFIDTRMSLSGEHIERLADIIEAEHCDGMYVPGYIAKDLLQNPQLKSKFRRIQSAMLSGERVPKASVQLKGAFFQDVYVYYGSTETGGVSMFRSDDIDDYEDGIIGTPLEGLEMKIVDGHGVTVTIGGTGEILVRSPWRFVGYKGSENLFLEAVDDKSWFHTGDVGHFRPDGNVVIEGRDKEHVTIQTVKYFPWEVESALKGLPGAKYVIAVGVPDVRLSNVFCACVVPQDHVILTEDDVRRHCDEIFLDEGTAGGVTTKPKYCLIFDELMLTTSGKINRRGMAQVARERLSL